MSLVLIRQDPDSNPTKGSFESVQHLIDNNGAITLARAKTRLSGSLAWSTPIKADYGASGDVLDNAGSQSGIIFYARFQGRRPAPMSGSLGCIKRCLATVIPLLFVDVYGERS